MGIPEYCRNNTQRLRLTGVKEVGSNGEILLSLTGANGVPPENGFHREENPLEGEIYRSKQQPGENGNMPQQIQGTVEISASVD